MHFRPTIQAKPKTFIERLYFKALSIGKLQQKHLALLFSIGLAIRIAGMFGLGDGDMEHFKAWTTLIHTYGLERTYSAPDRELIARARERNVSLVESFNSLRTWVTIEPLAFSERNYMVIYPPGSVYPLYLSGLAYKRISPEMRNSRLFNAFINFPMLLLSLGVTWLMFLFIRHNHHGLAVATAMMYWLNPIVLLDSTIQGYNNPIIALINLGALVSLYRSRYLLAVCLTTLGVLVKPQAMILLPIVAIVCLRETKARTWPVYALAGAVTALVFLSPFVLNGYTLSSLLGTTFAARSLDQWTLPVLSARCWNLWWPTHVAIYSLFGVKAVQLSEFTARFGANPRVLGSVAMVLVCAASLVQLYRQLPQRRIYIFLCMIMMGYAYTMVQVNVQFNQFFVFIPALLMIALANQRLFTTSVVIMIPWLAQLVVYGGLGRDFCCPSTVFGRLGLSHVFTGVTLLIALLNVFFWLQFGWRYFRGWFTTTGPLHAFGSTTPEPEELRRPEPD
ncbi:MAG: hypothetical protein HY644_10045 [Acidobacteria bacterium]|nr:hypothetical protein [Acidobacteriota bacterium]